MRLAGLHGMAWGRKLLVLAALTSTGQGLVSINTAAGNAYVRYHLSLPYDGWASGTAFCAGLYYADDPATLANGGGTLVRNGGVNGTGLAFFSTFNGQRWW